MIDRKCDANKNKKVELSEWKSCLVDQGWEWYQERIGKYACATARHQLMTSHTHLRFLPGVAVENTPDIDIQ